MDHIKGLVGLRSIRQRLGLSMPKLAQMAGLKHQDSIRFIETGHRDCTQATQRAIADALSCSVSDMLQVPTEDRLDEIEAAYLSQLANKAHAKVASRGVA